MAFFAEILLVSCFAGYIHYTVQQEIYANAKSAAMLVRKVFEREKESTIEELLRATHAKQRGPNITAFDQRWKKRAGDASSNTISPLFRWDLSLERPMVSQKTDLWVVPATVDIFDVKGTKKVGSMVKHITFRHLAQVLHTEAYPQGTLFALYDPRFGAICQSENNQCEHTSLTYKNILCTIQSTKKQQFRYKAPRFDALFLYHLAIPRTPYIILSGLSIAHLNNLYLKYFLHAAPIFLLSFFLLIAFLCFAMSMFRKRFKLYQKLLYAYVHNMAFESVNESIQGLEKDAPLKCDLPAKSLGTSEEKARTNLQKVIEECLFILTPQIEEKKLKIKKSFDRKLPYLSIAPFTLQKIILSLIHIAIEGDSYDKRLHIQIRYLAPHIIILLADTSFFLDTKSRLRFAQEAVQDIFRLDFQSLRMLVHQLGGTLTVAKRPEKGNIFKLQLPQQTHQKSIAAADNVVPLHNI